MALKLDSLDMRAKLPELPTSAPIYALSAPPLEERRAAIARLSDRLKLGTLRSVELDHGQVFASERGDITHFHASGAVWARDATASDGAVNEFRKWAGLADSNVDGQRNVLDPAATKRLIAQARELLEPLGLLGKEVASVSVQLDQVAQLDAKGKELAQGAGQACVKFGYEVRGVPVRGAGGKTLLFAEPGDNQPRVAGVFHAWRNVGGDTPIKLQRLEEALSVALLTDPELDRYGTAGHKVQITRLEYVYMALPAFMRQTQLFPMIQVEGIVSEGKLGISFHFGRMHHVASPKTYADAGLFAPYLLGNPDAIVPIAPKATRANLV